MYSINIDLINLKLKRKNWSLTSNFIYPIKRLTLNLNGYTIRICKQQIVVSNFVGNPEEIKFNIFTSAYQCKCSFNKMYDLINFYNYIYICGELPSILQSMFNHSSYMFFQLPFELCHNILSFINITVYSYK